MVALDLDVAYWVTQSLFCLLYCSAQGVIQNLLTMRAQFIGTLVYEITSNYCFDFTYESCNCCITSYFLE